ncbi:HD domain-containing protein [Dokdonella soli]|uniref:HD domain-containing protein n=1 Tax=Dokdonella soli TaxID=529810 RepID=A0ABN1IHM1_9GAMM
MLTERFTRATEYARETHAGQVRKGTSVPYLSHLLGVASLVLDYGGDEDQAIAGLLHDIVEDQGAHHEAIVRQRFGERVARIVMACTDGSHESRAEDVTPEQKRANWQARKTAYLEHLETQPDDVLLVSACDKLHNARAIVRDIRDPSVGAAVFERFTGKRDGTLWYYTSLADLCSLRNTPVAIELAAVVEEMRDMPGGSLSGMIINRGAF